MAHHRQSDSEEHDSVAGWSRDSENIDRVSDERSTITPGFDAAVRDTAYDTAAPNPVPALRSSVDAFTSHAPVLAPDLSSSDDDDSDDAANSNDAASDATPILLRTLHEVIEEARVDLRLVPVATFSSTTVVSGSCSNLRSSTVEFPLDDNVYDETVQPFPLSMSSEELHPYLQSLRLGPPQGMASSLHPSRCYTYCLLLSVGMIAAHI